MPVIEVTPEFGVLLPGQAQRLFLHATLNKKPVSAEFSLEGHVLTARLHTDERGWGEALWNVPREVGATVPGQSQSGCAGEVAATVRIRVLSPIPGLNRLPQPFEHCLRVDRDAFAVVRPSRPIARSGDELLVRVLGARSESSSVVLAGPNGTPAGSGWLSDVSRGGAIAIPAFAKGVWTLSAAGIAGEKDKRVLPASVLVVPRVLASLAARRVEGGRLAPGGSAVLEADLSDGHGQPLTGSVGAVVFDKFGGTHPESLLDLDTRHSLAASVGVDAWDVEGFLDGDASFERQRWAALAGQRPEALAPVFDPPATMQTEIEKAFRQIVQSLEGAVLESSGDPERLRDVRIRGAGGSALNPEMLTLVTEAMNEQPVTPGGEPWRLADLMAIDAQVKYDTVARRVTRLKLFRALSALRTYLFEHKLGADEPMLRDPNALLRRLVRDMVIEPGELLDPWGHGLSFVRASGPRLPFLSTVPGFRLLSAGPDGRFGTGDDVGDPFQRVLASKTPYAKAVEEDRLVDAKWDMQVGDETVEAWKKTLEELTGTTWDKEGTETYGVGGLGDLGAGSGGGGTGSASRSSKAVDPGPARWLPPIRTDDRGHVRLSVPLGDAETTWQIVLIAMPDQGSPAVTSVEVPISLPLSLKVNTGATWIAGDEVDVALDVRNRTATAQTVSLHVSASGSARLADLKSASQTLRVPAQSAATATVRVRGVWLGTGSLDVSLADGAAKIVDRVHHEWAIKPAGEVIMVSNAAVVERETTVTLPAATTATPAVGPARLVLERGLASVLTAALESLVPEQLNGQRSMADALEVFGRVRAWAIVRGGETDPWPCARASLRARSRHDGICCETKNRQATGKSRYFCAASVGRFRPNRLGRVTSRSRRRVRRAVATTTALPPRPIRSCPCSIGSTSPRARSKEQSGRAGRPSWHRRFSSSRPPTIPCSWPAPCFPCRTGPPKPRLLPPWPTG